MMLRRGAAVTVAALLLTSLAGCGGDDGDDDREAREDRCGSLLQQMDYSVLKQLVDAQQLAEPDVVIAKYPEVVKRDGGGRYELIDRATLLELDESLQASAMSTVRSAREGVGRLYTIDDVAQALQSSGPCKDDNPDD